MIVFQDEDNVPDRFVIYGEEYKKIREAMAKTVLGGTNRELTDALKVETILKYFSLTLSTILPSELFILLLSVLQLEVLNPKPKYLSLLIVIGDDITQALGQ